MKGNRYPMASECPTIQVLAAAWTWQVWYRGVVAHGCGKQAALRLHVMRQRAPLAGERQLHPLRKLRAGAVEPLPVGTVQQHIPALCELLVDQALVGTAFSFALPCPHACLHCSRG